MRLNQAAVDSERYTGTAWTDEEGRERWPSCTIWDEDVPGFGLRIHPPSPRGESRKEFVFSYRIGARSRVLVLGTYGSSYGLKQARREASEALALVRRGSDPIEARQQAMGIGTIDDIAQRFLERHVTSALRKTAVRGG